MATPFPFVSGAVLTAANLNSITELPTRTLTGSGAAIAADSYSRVILNGSSITYTINTSTFSAGQVVELYNANSTAATIAAGAGVTLNGAAGLTLAQYQTAELYAVSATSFVLWKSDVTQTAAGLELVTSQSIGTAVSSVTVSNVFSSTYDNYKILITPGTASTSLALRLQLGATTTGYYWGYRASNYAGGSAGSGSANGANFELSQTTTTAFGVNADLIAPNLAKNTLFYGQYIDPATTGAAGTIYGFLNDTTAYTAFTIVCSTGNITGGTIRVYGYKN